MKNKVITTIAGYSLIISLIYTFISFKGQSDAIDWPHYFATSGITWLIIFVLAYILYLFVSPKQEEQQQVSVTPSVQYFYHDYCNGFCRVEKITVDEQGNISSEFNFLNLEGKYISEKWYLAVSDFCKEGTALVTDGEMYNFMNTEGKIVCTNWFFGIEPFVDGIAKVRWKDNTVNFVTTEGKYLWDDWRPEIALDEVNISPSATGQEDNNKQ